ncbi:hypothetical protein CDV55_102575 [Aspergillus turcosus]|nr:hypothetical protein CDV55_102575 [Aspergillus turcosus]
MYSAATSATPAPNPASSERARERQVLQYLPYWILSPGEKEPEATSSFIPRSSADTGLTAFAQLAALRLNVKRSLIYLTDRRRQYIVGEATRTLSLWSDGTHAWGDEIWFGVRSVPRSSIPMCDYAIDSFARNGEVKFIVNDIPEDERFKDSDFVARYPSARFYMCVPIRSPSGHVIGGFCALDDNCRETVTEIEWQFMRDMAATVLDHLLTQRALREERRGEKMVKALGVFMEGKSSLNEWSDEDMGSGSRIYDRQEDGSSSTRYGVLPPVFKGSVVQARARDSGATSLRRPDIAGRSGSQISIKDGGGDIDILFQPELPSGQRKHIQPSDLPTKFGATHLKDSLPSIEVQAIFGRASHLIREGLGVEGAVFFDVGFSLSEDTLNLREMGVQPLETGITPNHGATSSSDDDVSSAESSLNWERNIQTCHVLGYSTAKSSSIDGKEIFRQHIPLPERFVKKLLKRYRQGKVFHVDDDGSLSASDDASQSSEDGPQPSATSAVGQHRRPKSKSSRKWIEMQTILRALPGARNIAFYPLWDFQRARWYAGCLVWTTDPLRILHETKELTYLMAFGSSIMAEVSKLDILLADRAKADFISSVSHELRSPLHGILATIDIFRDMDTSPVQQNLIKTIYSCGKTLLDTINHVLDFTKINTLAKSRRKPRASSSADSANPSILGVDDLFGDVDVSCLLEEVAEGLLAGQRYSGVGSSAHSRESSAAAKPVVVVLDIDWAHSWLCSISLGAWRRVIMNLVSNSLKYTERGHVEVSLRFCGGVAAWDDAAAPVAILLSVKDSGRGMSKSFLQNHLYTPFLQEDPLSEGTGLGVSIVRKIVDSLGGHICFRSEQDRGTEVEVVLPVVQPVSVPQTTPFFELRNKLKGRTIGIYLSESESASPLFGTHTMDVIQSDISRLCANWFGLNVTTHTAAEQQDPDIIVLTEQEYSDKWGLEKGPWLAASGSPRSCRNPIVLCTDMCRDLSADDVGGATRNPIFLYQPIGPRNLAAALEKYLKWEHVSPSIVDKSGSSSSRGGPEVANPSPTSKITVQPPELQRPSTGPLLRALPRQHFDGVAKTADEACSPLVLSPGEVEAQDVAPSFSAEDRRLLLVDDNNINRKATCNGLEALRMFKAERFDLVLMDISMPVMDGLTSTREIRRFEKANDMVATPIIALTGLASASIQQEAVDSGVTLFLTKPVPLKQLKTILSDVFGRLGKI